MHELREGFAMHLRPGKDAFVGATEETGCRTSIDDATHAPGEVVTKRDLMRGIS